MTLLIYLTIGILFAAAKSMIDDFTGSKQNNALLFAAVFLWPLLLVGRALCPPDKIKEDFNEW